VFLPALAVGSLSLAPADAYTPFPDMMTTRQRAQKGANGHANGRVPEKSNGFATGPVGDEKTDYSRWRLLDEDGRHTWHYLTTDKEVKAWPQTVADKFHLGLPTVSSLQ
jgi:hypothetical protein